MDSFQHVPLDRSKECIRLLRFVDRPPSSKLHHFALETYEIATAPHFVALSYTWGNPEPTRDMIIDGSVLSVRENLWAGLKVLRSFFSNKAQALDLLRPSKYNPEDLLQENGYPLMWIDAICINQSDPLEKNHQVNMMGRIFSTAARVISWVGDEADNSSSVMKAIRATQQKQIGTLEVKQALEAFAQRSYWRRMWVAQEFLLPLHLVILCGHEAARWEDLTHFWYHRKLRVVSGAYGDDWYFCAYELASLQRTGLAALIHARKSRHDGVGNYKYGTSPVSVDQILLRFTFGECSDPRDRIYALLPLIEPPDGVQPLLADYTISAECLYYRVLGYVGSLKHDSEWRRFRKQLAEALGSSSWADAEAAKMNEAVYEIVGIETALEISFQPFYFALAEEEKNPCTEVRECLAKHLEQPIDSDWTYQAIIRRFQAFPRGEDPRTWQRFENLLQRVLNKL